MTDSANPLAEFEIQVVPVTPLQQNASLLWSRGSREAVMIDPGGDLERLERQIEQHELNVTAIWLTHGHIDHVGAATAAKESLECPIIGPHVEDRFLLETAEQQGKAYNILDAKNVSPDRFLAEGDTVELAGLSFDVYHCPGHSPGHVVYHQKASDFAFVGDVLFNGSIGRTDLPGGNHEQLIKSIVEKLWPLGDVQFLPGHGAGSTFGAERSSNPFVSDAATGYDGSR